VGVTIPVLISDEADTQEVRVNVVCSVFHEEEEVDCPDTLPHFFYNSRFILNYF